MSSANLLSPHPSPSHKKLSPSLRLTPVKDKSYFTSQNALTVMKFTGTFLYGSTYFTAVLSGEQSLENFFSWKSSLSSTVFKGLGVVSCLSHSASFYELCEKLTRLIPQKPLGKALALGGLLSSINFFVASLSGSQQAGIPREVAYAIATVLYLHRLTFSFYGAEAITNSDLKLPNASLEGLDNYSEKSLQLLRNTFVVSSALCLSACETDSIYEIVHSILETVGVTDTQTLHASSMVGALLGFTSSTVGGVAWGRITIDALTNFKTGEFSHHSKTSFYTCLALGVVWCAFVIIGPIGVVAPESIIQNGSMLTKLFGTETQAQQNANITFRICALLAGFLPFTAYVHYKTIHRILFHDQPLERPLSPLA
jgi:hypothetical protein